MGKKGGRGHLLMGRVEDEEDEECGLLRLLGVKQIIGFSV